MNISSMQMTILRYSVALGGVYRTGVFGCAWDDVQHLIDLGLMKEMEDEKGFVPCTFRITKAGLDLTRSA
jgi:hypothetical protein